MANVLIRRVTTLVVMTAVSGGKDVRTKAFLTRKSKTEAVLQRRSMLKLGVICEFMKRYGKCFMS